ncbi:nuclear transport factor 2 family protein [Saccharomonospora saliphila]|uniref:nuclear transport factor 2 family protein n=1 Tax=Saccharomonospora saliphila TaxID=369829 RepID=UPI00048F9713|nr:nuclear transport factor 2 family protein [Saccharomonospora saliphila]
MAQERIVARPYVSGEVYAAVQHFYARQMALLDEGSGDAWADTFSEDAVFAEPRMPEPLIGREAIRASVHRTIAGHRDAGRTTRHWFGMLVVEPGPEGVLHTRSYALTMVTPSGGSVGILGHAVCRDQLVAAGDGQDYLVRHRDIAPDGV